MKRVVARADRLRDRNEVATSAADLANNCSRRVCRFVLELIGKPRKVALLPVCGCCEIQLVSPPCLASYLLLITTQTRSAGFLDVHVAEPRRL